MTTCTWENFQAGSQRLCPAESSWRPKNLRIGPRNSRLNAKYTKGLTMLFRVINQYSQASDDSGSKTTEKTLSLCTSLLLGPKASYDLVFVSELVKCISVRLFSPTLCMNKKREKALRQLTTL